MQYLEHIYMTCCLCEMHPASHLATLGAEPRELPGTCPGPGSCGRGAEEIGFVQPLKDLAEELYLESEKSRNQGWLLSFKPPQLVVPWLRWRRWEGSGLWVPWDGHRSHWWGGVGWTSRWRCGSLILSELEIIVFCSIGHHICLALSPFSLHWVFPCSSGRREKQLRALRLGQATT